MTVLFAMVTPFALAQQRSASPEHQLSAKSVPSSIEVLSERGGATVFTDRAAFEAACGMLTTEDFEEANLPSGEFAAINAPLPPADGVIFQPGDIEPGLIVTLDSTGVNPDTGDPDDLFVARDFFSVGVQVGNNTIFDKLIYSFSPAVECAGYDVDLNRNGAETTLRAVDGGGNTLGSVSITGFDLFFFGVMSDVPVASLIADGDISEEFVDADNASYTAMMTGDNFEIDADPESQTVTAPGTANFTYTVTNNTASAQSGVVFYQAFLGSNPVSPVVQVQS
ncbi:MAG: hypothetical protein AAGI91_06340, partial [Bacteroidota bacterium]